MKPKPHKGAEMDSNWSESSQPKTIISQNYRRESRLRRFFSSWGSLGYDWAAAAWDWAAVAGRAFWSIEKSNKDDRQGRLTILFFILFVAFAVAGVMQQGTLVFIIWAAAGFVIFAMNVNDWLG